MNNDYQDKIDRYLLGKMSETESLNFEKEIINDKDLKEQLEFTKDVKEAIVGRSRRLAQIKEWKEAYEIKNKLESRTSTRRYLYWISGIAAIFIVGFFMFSPIVHENGGSPDHPLSVNVSSLRSTEDNTDIAKMINDGNYDLALEQIKEKVKKVERDKRQTEQNKSEMDGEEYVYLNTVHEIQMEELNLLKVYALIGLERSKEAVAILDELRQPQKTFKAQADSLYNLYIK